MHPDWVVPTARMSSTILYMYTRHKQWVGGSVDETNLPDQAARVRLAPEGLKQPRTAEKHYERNS
jgi:hypothetical protein